MTSRIAAAVLLTGVALGACRETRSAPALPSSALLPRDSSELRLVVADTAPAVGSAVRVAAMYFGGDTSMRAASFTARIAYDMSALRYDGEVPLADGAMRAANATGAELRIAGASARGFESPELFVATFTVLRGGALESLRLRVDELHDVSARDLRASSRVSPHVQLSPGAPRR